jgi:hypothetical protein
MKNALTFRVSPESCGRSPGGNAPGKRSNHARALKGRRKEPARKLTSRSNRSKTDSNQKFVLICVIRVKGFVSQIELMQAIASHSKRFSEKKDCLKSVFVRVHPWLKVAGLCVIPCIRKGQIAIRTQFHSKRPVLQTLTMKKFLF